MSSSVPEGPSKKGVEGPFTRASSDRTGHGMDGTTFRFDDRKKVFTVRLEKTVCPEKLWMLPPLEVFMVGLDGTLCNLV